MLSLDGGGVRGLSSLYILKLLMEELNQERKRLALPRGKPCDVCDLIGGTSTGGYVLLLFPLLDMYLIFLLRIIAIMLGRLEMDVDECIDAYTRLMNDVFRKRSFRAYFALLRGKIKGRFSSKQLEDAVRKILVLRKIGSKDLFYDYNDVQDENSNNIESRKCKV